MTTRPDECHRDSLRHLIQRSKLYDIYRTLHPPEQLQKAVVQTDLLPVVHFLSQQVHDKKHNYHWYWDNLFYSLDLVNLSQVPVHVALDHWQ